MNNTDFAEEILQIVNEFEMSVMHRSANFWKWPQREDNILR